MTGEDRSVEGPLARRRIHTVGSAMIQRRARVGRGGAPALTYLDLAAAPRLCPAAEEAAAADAAREREAAIRAAAAAAEYVDDRRIDVLAAQAASIDSERVDRRADILRLEKELHAKRQQLAAAHVEAARMTALRHQLDSLANDYVQGLTLEEFERRQQQAVDAVMAAVQESMRAQAARLQQDLMARTRHAEDVFAALANRGFVVRLAAAGAPAAPAAPAASAAEPAAETDAERRSRHAAERAANHSDEAASIAYSRECSVCRAPNPLERVAMVCCGHLCCRTCAEEMAANEQRGGLVHCHLCRKDTTHIRIFEDLETEKAFRLKKEEAVGRKRRRVRSE